MRVALLATTVDFGGIEKVLLTMLEHMGRDVEIVPLLFTRTDARDRTFFARLDALQIAYRTVYVNRSRPKYFNPIRNLAETVGALRHEPIDLIHSHGYRADLIALAAARYLGVPVLSTCHGFILNDRNLSLYARLDVRLLRYFERVIAVSERMREDLVTQGVPAERVVVVPNAIALPAPGSVETGRREARASLGVADEEVLFGYVGRLSEEKGVHHLIEAVRTMATHGAPWRLLVVGDGPQRRELEAAVGDDLARHVNFVGFQAETSRWYSAMDAFVLPSLTEGTPMALLEAMAHRVPTAASAVGGVPAVITDRVNGLLVPPANVPALASVLGEIASNELLRRSIGDAGFRTVCQRYDVGTWIARVRRVYEESLLQGRRAA